MFTGHILRSIQKYNHVIIYKYGQPMKLTKDWGDIFIYSSISYSPCHRVPCSLTVLKLTLCDTV